MAIRVKAVEEGSPAEQAGIQPSMLLLEADGNPLNDMLDYEFYTAASRIRLKVRPQEGQEQSSGMSHSLRRETGFILTP